MNRFNTQTQAPRQAQMKATRREQEALHLFTQTHAMQVRFPVIIAHIFRRDIQVRQEVHLRGSRVETSRTQASASTRRCYLQTLLQAQSAFVQATFFGHRVSCLYPRARWMQSSVLSERRRTIQTSSSADGQMHGWRRHRDAH